MGFFSNLFGKNKPTKSINETQEKGKTEQKPELIVNSPVAGKVKILSEVSDQVFSEEMAGKGIAVVPSDDVKVVLSPIKGKIKVAFPTGHAYGISSSVGPELLVHIGLDTVELDGKGFVKKVEVDNEVDTNTELCDLDLTIIKENEKETDIIVIATNDSITDSEIVLIANNGDEVKAGDPLYKIVKK